MKVEHIFKNMFTELGKSEPCLYGTYNNNTKKQFNDITLITKISQFDEELAHISPSS